MCKEPVCSPVTLADRVNQVLCGIQICVPFPQAILTPPAISSVIKPEVEMIVPAHVNPLKHHRPGKKSEIDFFENYKGKNLFLLFRVVEEKPVDVFRISIRHKKPICCAVRTANLPNSSPVSRTCVSYFP